jgi:hypothetical protein
VEICQHRRRRRRGRDEIRLTEDPQRLLKNPGPDRSGRIQVNEPKFDLASNAELQKGLVLLSHCRGARGIGVRPFRAATVCEFEPALETDRVMQSGSDHGSRSCTRSGLIKPKPCLVRRRQHFRRDDETRVKDMRFAHAGFAGVTPISPSPSSPPTAKGDMSNCPHHALLQQKLLTRRPPCESNW